jgi:hypothetical protein
VDSLLEESGFEPPVPLGGDGPETASPSFWTRAGRLKTLLMLF